MRILSVLLTALFLHTTLAYPDGTRIAVVTCSASSDHQSWTYHTDDLTLRLKADDKCIDINNYGTNNGDRVWLYGCHTDDKNPGHQNQEWKLNADGTIRATMSGKCLESAVATPGAIVQIWDCNGGSNQKWTYHSDTGFYVNSQSGLCLDAGTPIPLGCDNPINKVRPFCDINLSFEARVADIIQRIPVQEKIGLLGNGALDIPSLNISSYQWWSEALHGVAGSPGVAFGWNVPFATSFPQVIGLGATFDMPLVNQVGQVISTEARGMNHEGHAGLTYWTPNVNIYRDPRWGRGQETPGEDPYLSAEYARNFITGLQGDQHYLKVSSCCKHYTAYDLEDWGGVDRHHFNAIVTDQDLQDTFMPPFKSCVEGGHVTSLMCSYNSVNGIPSCTNKLYNNEYARNQWGFQGYITGDCGAVDDVIYTHHYTSNEAETCKAVLQGGLDSDCGGFLQSHLPAAIQSNVVTTADLNTALSHLFLVQFRLGFFDPDNVQPYRQLSASDVNTQPHQALALTVSLESMTLLKNDGGTLPFDKNNIKSIALIGPNAQATQTMQGNYYGNAPYLITPEAGLNKFTKTVYAKGADINSNDQSGFNDACNAAKSADATVLVVGIDQNIESEGKDRNSITLPGVQNQLITQVAGCSKGPVVVVVMAGGNLDLSVPKNLNTVKSILWVGYPGQSGGDAIAQTIFGVNSPAGRLPYTLYEADFVNKVSMFDMGMRPNASNGNPGRSYRFYTGNPVYKFGDGLSYTVFNFTWSNQSPQTIPASYLAKFLGDDIYSPWKSKTLAQVTVTVTNNGKRSSDVSVLAFMTPPNAGKNGNPLKYLFGFTRLHSMAPGAKQTISFPATAHDLSLVNQLGKREVVPGVWKVTIGDIEQEITISP